MLPYSNNRIAAVLILVLFLAIAAYAYFEAQGILYGPSIEIATPSDAPLTVEVELVHIRGAAENIAELYMNSNPISVTEAGIFDEALLLAPGYNKVVLMARDKFGRSTTKTLEIIYQKDDSESPTVRNLIESATTSSNQ